MSFVTVHDEKSVKPKMWPGKIYQHHGDCTKCVPFTANTI